MGLLFISPLYTSLSLSSCMDRLSLHLQLFRFKWGKGERRRRLPVSCPCRRVRDESLVLQHDGIQGAFCHCKGSYNSMRETRVFGNHFSRASVNVNLQLCQARHLCLSNWEENIDERGSLRRSALAGEAYSRTPGLTTPSMPERTSPITKRSIPRTPIPSLNSSIRLIPIPSGSSTRSLTSPNNPFLLFYLVDEVAANKLKQMCCG
ncbi:hypothetical protein RHMOL_Rhmol12G0109800 [Rhododendron molle]|uniref:Uncharacterized protein n=7 Tax=Rhododendron molle TaxID=49168 RepID=A0ACC0LHQ5_RHOML|nr:hypothetical protein RHMOL_Rhmol12G0109800 [Rhododendron molle]KAI8527898.1 hypothetical protein RHMOL_Rhmol12G0109800 [Rhododendron molle]KAI8527899.1 hypothetical protein RHMOL_Rhmol12G0109800 [Rhododendron molle]KAI8527900.1 hypothetical protein RHMOL_Rhmol12G0109800 [Rhododendron molle]KAI8527901.1 hypothetical protein RHMOL_Rhmol12G0109800 [Rhododendron molle]